MPIISMFYGIIVRIQKENQTKHKKPHIHARFAEYDISIDLEGNILKGEMPKKQLYMLKAWIAIHTDELKANWELINSGEKPYKIKPLK